MTESQHREEFHSGPEKLGSSAMVIIPARLQSTRLPGKLLLKAGGKSVLQHTYEAARESALTGIPVVATDSQEILAEVVSFGGRVVLTRADHLCGTDRVAEAAEHFPEAQVIVNVQGDEPELPPGAIDQLVELLRRHPSWQMATLATPIRDQKHLHDPSCVKVVLGKVPSEASMATQGTSAGLFSGRALYFSRAAVPFVAESDPPSFDLDRPLFWHHVGIYAYRRAFLMDLVSRPASPLEQIEKLEQLRVLEAGGGILVGRIEQAAAGIDTPEDFEAFRLRVEGSAATSYSSVNKVSPQAA